MIPGKLVKLGTNWTLTSLGYYRPYTTKTYKTGHHFPGGKEAFFARPLDCGVHTKVTGSNAPAAKLGTNWALTSFGLYLHYPATTYKTGHHFPGETYRQKSLSLVEAVHDHR